MDPLTIGLIAGIPSLALGAYQAYQGYQLGQKKRPEYEIPGAIKSMLGMSERMATEGLPGEAAIRESITGSTSRGANLLERSAQGAQLLGGITDIVGSEQGQLTNLGVQSAQQKVLNQQRLQDALNTYAQYEDKQFEINELQPYLQAMQQAQALTSAGVQNVVGGLGGLVSNSGQLAFNNDYLSMLKNIYSKD